MAKQVLTNAKVFLDGSDLSGYLNAVAINYSAEMLDDTAFGDDTKSSLGGLKAVTAQHEGFWNSPHDEALFGLIGYQNKPMTVCPDAGAAGDRAFFFNSELAEYSPGGAHGELYAFSVSANSSGDLVRGEILINASAAIASGNGAGANLGAVSAGQKLYAALHVLSASAADTLDVTIESDIDNTFTSAVDQIVFTQATDEGGQYAEKAGPITDTWFRIKYTIGGTSPSFDFVVAVGIR